MYLYINKSDYLFSIKVISRLFLLAMFWLVCGGEFVISWLIFEFVMVYFWYKKNVFGYHQLEVFHFLVVHPDLTFEGSHAAQNSSEISFKKMYERTHISY